MNLVQNSGKYLGTVKDLKVDRSKNGFIQVIATGVATKEFNEDEGKYVDMSEPLRVPTAYLMLTGSGGKNANQINCMKSAFGWDGKKPSALMEMYEGKEVKFTVNEDEEGKLSTDWIDGLGGLRPVDPDTVKSIDEEWDGTDESSDDGFPAF